MSWQNSSVPASCCNPRWASTRRNAGSWERIGASAFFTRSLVFEAWDPPKRPFAHGKELPNIPQTENDLEFALLELSEGYRVGTYQLASTAHARDQLKKEH